MIGTARCVTCIVRPARMTEGRKRACTVCSTQLYDMLADIATLSSFLRVLLAPGRALSDQPVGRATDAAPAPLRVDVLALLTDTGDLSIAGVLGPYVAATARGRHLSAEQPYAPEMLRRHVDWLIEQPWLEEFTADVRRIQRSVKAVCGEGTTVVAVHQEPTGDAGRVCGGSIVASTWTDEAACTACGASWPRRRWRELGARQREAAHT